MTAEALRGGGRFPLTSTSKLGCGAGASGMGATAAGAAAAVGGPASGAAAGVASTDPVGRRDATVGDLGPDVAGANEPAEHQREDRE